MGRVRVLKVVDPAAIHGGGSPDDAVYLVTLLQQKLGEIRAVLSCYASDQRSFWHGNGKV